MSDDATEPEMGYTEYRCTNCGHATPKNTPPCDRCGNYELEAVRVTESDFDDEVSVPGTLSMVKENPGTAAAAIVIALTVVVGGLAWFGAFVLADPTGTYRFGGVSATPVDGDGTLTASEFRTRLADGHDIQGMHWVGTELRVTVADDEATNAAVVDEVMEIALAYAEYVGSGGEAGSLVVTVETPEGRAQVRIDSADARAFSNGELSEDEYRQRIFGG